MGAIYDGRVALVTGTRKGIGEALARHFLDEGATVFGLSRHAGTIDHPSYTHFVCDVRDEQGVRSTFKKIGSRSPLHIVINNSAIATSGIPSHSLLLSAKNAEEMLMTNLLGPFLVSREAAKLMKRSGSGRIVNIGSMSAALEPVGDSVYAASKAGLITMTNVLAKEFGVFRITCNTLGVTAIQSDMLDQLPREKMDAIIEGLPIPRYAQVDDILNVVDFFASERSSNITAQTVYLGGVHG